MSDETIEIISLLNFVNIWKARNYFKFVLCFSYNSPSVIVPKGKKFSSNKIGLLLVNVQ